MTKFSDRHTVRFLEPSPQFTVHIFSQYFNGFRGQVFRARFSGQDSVGQIGNLGSRDRGIHSVLKCNAPDESDFFCITFYGFWSKMIFKIEIAPTEWILGNIFLDLISLESRVPWSVTNICTSNVVWLCTEICTWSRGNVTFFIKSDIFDRKDRAV